MMWFTTNGVRGSRVALAVWVLAGSLGCMETQQAGAVPSRLTQMTSAASSPGTTVPRRESG